MTEATFTTSSPGNGSGPRHRLKHVIDARQFDRQWLEEVLFPEAAELQSLPFDSLPKPLAGKRLLQLYYQPSTRTRLSFETAVNLLGGSAMAIDGNGVGRESERLEDRIIVVNDYGYDFIVLRYSQAGGASRAAAVSRAPIINAGDGDGQHPTQALLDAYTLWRDFGSLDGLRVALVGDLRYERTTNSLAYVLSMFAGVKLSLVSPQALQISDELRLYLSEHNVELEEMSDLGDVISNVDVVYMTKAHSTRMDYAQRIDRGAGNYRLNDELMARLPTRALVLHPLPRGPELPPELDSDSRVSCFRQAQNGLFLRMALLRLLAEDRS